MGPVLGRAENSSKPVVARLSGAERILVSRVHSSEGTCGARDAELARGAALRDSVSCLRRPLTKSWGVFPGMEPGVTWACYIDSNTRPSQKVAAFLAQNSPFRLRLSGLATIDVISGGYRHRAAFDFRFLGDFGHSPSVGVSRGGRRFIGPPGSHPSHADARGPARGQLDSLFNARVGCNRAMRGSA
jgi:hypothetical protein